MDGPRLRTEEGRIRSRVVLGSISVLLVIGGAAGATYFVHAHRRRTITLHPTRGARASHPPAFVVVASSPAAGQHAVKFAPLIRVQFSQPLARRWARPTLTPAIPGSWMRIGPAVLEFRPKANFVPSTKVTLAIVGGKAGVRDHAGGVLARSYRASFVIAEGSVLRLQQLLAELGYLPLDFEGATSVTLGSTHTVARAAPLPPFAGASSSSSALAKGPTHAVESQTTTITSPPSSRAQIATATLDPEATSSGAVELTPEPGSFSWRYPSIPSSLAVAWQPGVETALVRGAVMAFQSADGIPADGDAGSEVWTALLKAIAKRQVTTAPYDYLEVTTTSPETLSVWRDGKVIYQSLANTGIPEEPTAPGTYTVYLRYASTTMSGYNPNGSHYSDPGVPYVAYFNGGDAVHGFLRAQYGYPQSLGCVELAYANAAVVFNYDPIGTLVNVA